MKIQDFCSKIRDDKGVVFQALSKLRKLNAQTLLEGSDPTTSGWDPWGVDLQPAELV